MNVDLTPIDIETLLRSLEYSKRNIQDTQGTPDTVRQENLSRLDEVVLKLQEAKRSN